MLQPKISVIVPVYKAECFLHKCIDSVIAQTYTNWELLLIDDGSPDKSGEICEQYAKDNKRIVPFHIENGGPSNARNYGLYHATGQYVCFIDSDDWVEPTYLEHLYNGEQREGVGVVIGGHVRYEVSNTIVRSVGDKLYDKSAFNLIFEGQRIAHWGYTVAKLYELNTLNRAKLRFPQNIKYCEDLIFFLEYWKYCDWVKFIPETDYHYIIAETSNSLIVSYNSFESELEGYKRCRHLFEVLAERFNASETEIRHSYEWCAYMFTRAIKTMYRKGRNKLPYNERYKRLREISNDDVRFAIRFPYYGSFEKLMLKLLDNKQYFFLDILLSSFFALRYSKILQPIANRKIKAKKK